MAVSFHQEKIIAYQIKNIILLRKLHKLMKLNFYHPFTLEMPDVRLSLLTKGVRRYLSFIFFIGFLSLITPTLTWGEIETISQLRKNFQISQEEASDDQLNQFLTDRNNRMFIKGMLNQINYGKEVDLFLAGKASELPEIGQEVFTYFGNKIFFESVKILGEKAQIMWLGPTITIIGVISTTLKGAQIYINFSKVLASRGQRQILIEYNQMRKGSDDWGRIFNDLYETYSPVINEIISLSKPLSLSKFYITGQDKRSFMFFIELSYQSLLLFKDQNRREDIKKYILRTITVKQPAGLSTVLCRLAEVKENYYLEPLVIYEAGNYKSLYIEAWNKEDRKFSSAKQALEGYRTFWLYYKGILVGNFEVRAIEKIDPGIGSQIAIKGEVRWQQSKPKGDIREILKNTIALSRAIPQGFWPQNLKLSPDQTVDLNRILKETLMRAPTLVVSELSKRGGLSQTPQRFIGNSPKNQSADLLDLDQDGRPEVFATINWSGKPCQEIDAKVFAAWRGKWEVFKRSLYLTICPWEEAAGDDDFSIFAIADIDGDGVAEVILSEGKWEAWKLVLYKIRNGKFIKIIHIGDYGC